MVGFQCFQVNFFFVNQLRGGIKKEKLEFVFRSVPGKVQGQDLVWEYAVVNESNAVRERARNFLIDLILNNTHEKFEQRGKFYNEFIDTWLLKTENPNFMQPSSLHNLLLILFNFVNKCNGIGLHDEPLDFEDKSNLETIKIKVDNFKLK